MLCLLSVNSCRRGEPASTSQESKADAKPQDRSQAIHEEWVEERTTLSRRAVFYKDYKSAVLPLLDLIDRDPDHKAQWMEEAAKIYYLDQRYSSCSEICADLVAHHGGDTRIGILEMRAVSYEMLGRKDEAVETWTQAMRLGGTPVHATRLACLLFEAGKFAEADQLVQTALSSPSLSDSNQVLKLPVADNRSENIPVEAALQNLLGLIAIKRNPPDPVAARAAFERAVKVAPSYIVARHNLEEAAIKPTASSGQ